MLAVKYGNTWPLALQFENPGREKCKKLEYDFPLINFHIAQI